MEDIDWRAGTIRVSANKSHRVDISPLPTETGIAIAEYLRAERPKTSSRALFVRHVAPKTFDFAAHDSPHYGNALVAIGGGHQRDCAMARARKPSTTHMYTEADISMKERALQRLTPSAPNKARYRPPNSFFRFLQSL